MMIQKENRCRKDSGIMWLMPIEIAGRPTQRTPTQAYYFNPLLNTSFVGPIHSIMMQENKEWLRDDEKNVVDAH